MYSPLPSAWVDRLFARLAVRYGSAWIRMWEGVPMDAVKADWAEELAGFAALPEALAYGLDNLPLDKPPTVKQFAATCNRIPEKAPLAIEGPIASPAIVAKVRQGLRPSDPDPLAWARKLRAKEAACERLTAFQRKAWRDALHGEAA
jgi:hypothetical protein